MKIASLFHIKRDVTRMNEDTPHSIGFNLTRTVSCAYHATDNFSQIYETYALKKTKIKIVRLY
eukprot:snap_masked-scaffold_11-processed-gene-5.38-mRNA-1 protein AED:1.00 eAED:1.00 QI:0/0/0/0/1/1/2/0/62